MAKWNNTRSGKGWSTAEEGLQSTANLARYEAATVTGFHSNWSPQVQEADQEIFRDIARLRARSQDLHINNPWVKAGLRAVQRYVLGDGFRIIAKPEYEAIWNDWSKYAGFDNVSNLTGILEKLITSEVQGGDALVLFTTDPTETEDNISFRLDVIASERVVSTPDIKTAINGVNRNAKGQVVGWFAARDPSKASKREDLSYFALSRGNSPNAKLLICPEVPVRPIQGRGVPLIAQSMLRFEALARFDDHTLQQAYLRSTIPAAIESADLKGMSDRLTGQTAPGAPKMGVLDGVRVIMLPPGDKISWGNVATVDPNFPAYVKALLNECYSVYPIPASVIVQDYDAANFSSVRAMFSDAYQACSAWRRQIIDEVLKVAVRQVLTEAAILGMIPTPTEEEFAQISFIGKAPDAVRPQDLVNAEKTALDAGITSIQQVCARYGVDWKQVIRERIEAEKYEQELRENK